MPTLLPALWTAAAAVPAVAAAGSVGYLLTLLGAAALPRQRRRAADVVRASAHVEIIVPAHDEEPVIAATLRSLLAQEYPTELRTVVVVADNCTDRTAEIARSFPGVVVLERTNARERGKGYALDWAFQQRLALRPRPADAFVIVDADTEAAPDFLRRLLSSLLTRRDSAGRAAVQGRYGVLNASDSWRSSLMAAAFDLVNHVKPLGADRLGLSVDLKGNGMAFTRETLAAARWSGKSITEDIDFGLDLLEKHGLRVGYVPRAVVRAQMPVTAAQSGSQRDRWERGRYKLMRERALPLMLSGVRHLSPRLFEAGLRLVVPPLAELALLCLVALTVSVAGWRLGGLPDAPFWVSLSGSAFAGLLLYILCGLKVAGAPRGAFAALAMAPAYAAWKLVRLAAGPLLRRRRGGSAAASAGDEWVRTERIPVSPTTTASAAGAPVAAGEGPSA